MKKALALYCFVVLFGISTVKSATRSDTSIVVNGTEHKLCINLPSDYDPGNSYPLIVALHYCGGTSSQYCNAMASVCDSMKMIIACPDNSSQEMTNAAFITASIDTALHLFSIDENEVYLTGMSCNGNFALRMGLDEIYPFKGIFPWAPWFTSINGNEINFDSDIPTVLSIGTSDPNYSTILNLYDSLMTHGADVNLVIVQGIGHTLGFDQFGNEMLRCVKYIDDTNAISISPVPDITMNDNDTAMGIDVDVIDENGKGLSIRALSSKTSILTNPEVMMSSGSNTIRIRIAPLPGKSGTAKVILEAAENDGYAIEQTVFDVTINQSISQIGEKRLDPEISVFPVPANGFLYIRSKEETLTISIFDSLGKTVFPESLIDTSAPVDISRLSGGVYFLTALYNQGRETVKFVIR